MNISKKWYKPLRIVSTVFAMSLCMSFSMTAVRHGFDSAFLGEWLRNWRVAVLIALPTATVMVSLVDVLFNRILPFK
ncbi:DUF2798 domain-containing protein [Neisseria perflava]|uniref:DUF2798 domain-containing protein n=1 Tax=Neisseria perflava TaxID=33053 RepID=UPI00209EA14B|nr:DUF2798 domain-containing protein [Neisseria perflava]MCP1660725.1 hypothetical protein [Neisseria perflava]MCP1772947.1 hypothetical protein [Neisseria perflava]